MNDSGLHNLAPLVFTVIFVVAALARRMRRPGGPRPERKAAGNSLVPPPRTAAAPPPAAAARPVRRRLAEPATPPPPTPQVRPTLAPAMGDMLSNEAAAAFPALDLSLGDGSPANAGAAARPRARRITGGAAIGSRGWGVNAIVAAEILGTPVGLRPGATVGVPHAF
ncbi:MAG: hypothetical protein ABSH03_15745 [Candidatus Lustribacter sp.]